MTLTTADSAEIIRQARVRAHDIDALEKRLDHMREVRAIDAAWLVLNTTLTRSAIAALLGISRVTLNQYLTDRGMSQEMINQVHNKKQQDGTQLFDMHDYESLTLPERPGE